MATGGCSLPEGAVNVGTGLEGSPGVTSCEWSRALRQACLSCQLVCRPGRGRPNDMSTERHAEGWPESFSVTSGHRTEPCWSSIQMHRNYTHRLFERFGVVRGPANRNSDGPPGTIAGNVVSLYSSWAQLPPRTPVRY